MKSIILLLLIFIYAGDISAGVFARKPGSDRVQSICSSIESYIAGVDARVGVAVIVDGIDTVSVNGNLALPMLSVYKFPQALAVADYCDRHGVNLSDSVLIDASEIKENTYSPLRDKYGRIDLKLPVKELLAYSIQMSDNNACDILFRMIGGIDIANSYIASLNCSDISILSTEDEMHANNNLCYKNCATPIALARLLDKFDVELRYESSNMAAVAEMMEEVTTGVGRLAAALPDDVILGHKTGTGDRNSDGKIIAVNDIGYVHLTDGHRYVIAVLVSDSSYDMEATSKIIADISHLVFNVIVGDKDNRADKLK